MAKRSPLNSVHVWVLALTIIAMLPFGTVMVRNAMRDWNESLETAHTELDSSAREIAMDLGTWVQTSKRLMEQFSQHPSIQAMRCDAWLSDFIAIDRSITTIMLITSDGSVACDLQSAQPRRTASQVRESQWFKDAAEADGFRAGNIMDPADRNIWVVPVSYPIRAADGTVTGYLFVGHKLNDLRPDLFRGLPPSAVGGLVDGSRTFMRRSRDSEKFLGLTARPEQLLTKIGPTKTGGMQFRAEGREGERVMLMRHIVPGTDWKVYTSLSDQAVVAAQRAGLIDDAQLLMGASVFILLVGFVMSRAIAKPIATLTQATRGAAAGTLAEPVTLAGPAELRHLAANFNALMQARNSFAQGLKKSEKRYRDLMASVDAVVWEADPSNFRLTFVNEQAERLLGYPSEDWINDPQFWVKHVHPDDRQRTIAESRAGNTTGGSWEQTYRMIDINGRIVWVRNLCKLVTDDVITPVVRGVTIDITQQMIADERLRLALDAAGDSAFDWDMQNDKLIFTDGWYALTGYTRGEIPEDLMGFVEFTHPDDREKPTKDTHDLFAGRISTYSNEQRVRCKNGSWKWILTRGMVIARTASGKPVRMVGTHTDLTALRKADANRKAALQQYSDLVSAARDPIIAIDSKGLIQLCNAAAIETFGYSEQELLKHSLDLLLPFDVHARHGDWLKSFFAAPDSARSMAQLRTVDGRRKDGSKLRLQITLSKTTGADGDLATAVIRDVTEIETLHEQLHQADKLAAIGQLTGGVAHDINNLMAVMMGSAELIHYSVEAGSTVDTMAKRIVNAGKRGAELIRRLLVFSRKANVRPEDIELSSLLTELSDTLRRTLGARIDIGVNEPSDKLYIHVDRSMLESCLINLSVNARDAMPNGGKLMFDVKNEIRKGDKGLEDWVVLRVTDTGSGMADDVKKHVFEPFFTTKPMGSGTGLGLSMVYGFVQQSGGDITVESEVGLGTTFTLRFRMVNKDQADETSLPTDEKLALPGAGKLVLLVEDNEFVRQTLCDQLERLGCNVIEAASVSQARSMLQVMPDVNFVFSDFDLGSGETGVDLAEWIQSSGRKIPGAIVSGYLTTPVERIAAVGWSHLMKPVQFTEIAKLLKGADKARVALGA